MSMSAKIVHLQTERRVRRYSPRQSAVTLALLTHKIEQRLAEVDRLWPLNCEVVDLRELTRVLTIDGGNVA